MPRFAFLMAVALGLLVISCGPRDVIEPAVRFPLARDDAQFGRNIASTIIVGSPMSEGLSRLRASGFSCREYGENMQRPPGAFCEFRLARPGPLNDVWRVTIDRDSNDEVTAVSSGFGQVGL